jgi:hypothetical protein
VAADGQGELICEQYGVEFTADHQLIPLVVASDGFVQAVTALAWSFTVSFADPNILPAALVGGGTCNAPTFFDNDQAMFLEFSPWPADYVRAQ